MIAIPYEDRVHLMVDRTDDPKPDAPRRMEILNGADRRRRWSDGEKARIVAETLAPGAVVAQIARRYDVRAQQIHGWRKDAREGRLVLPIDRALTFAPVVVDESAASSKATRLRCNAPVIEVEADFIVARIRDGADIALVEAVVRALKAGA